MLFLLNVFFCSLLYLDIILLTSSFRLVHVSWFRQEMDIFHWHSKICVILGLGLCFFDRFSFLVIFTVTSQFQSVFMLFFSVLKKFSLCLPCDWSR